MTAVFVGHFEPGSDEWHAARADGLGGSEMAPLLGLSPHTSYFSLYHAKTGEYSVEIVNEEMEAGTRLEPVIVQKFADSHPEFSVRTPAGTWRHDERAWQIANPDALLYTTPLYPSALLETKFALYDDKWGPVVIEHCDLCGFSHGSDEIPIHYRCQVQHYLDTFGLDLAFVEVFIGSQGQFREYVVHAHADDQARLRAAGVEFMDRVRRGERPEIDGHDATYEVVKGLHPEITPMSVEIPEDIYRQFCLAKAAEKSAKQDATRATAVLADFMGNAQRAVFAGRAVANRQARGDGVPYVVAARGLPTFDLEAIAS